MCAAPGSKVNNQLFDHFAYPISVVRQPNYLKHYTQTIPPPQHQHPPASSSPTTAIPDVLTFSFTNPLVSQVPPSWSPIWMRRFIPSFDRQRSKNVAQSKRPRVNFSSTVSSATYLAAEMERCERTLASGNVGNPWMETVCMGSFCPLKMPRL